MYITFFYKVLFLELIIHDTKNEKSIYDIIHILK